MTRFYWRSFAFHAEKQDIVRVLHFDHINQYASHFLRINSLIYRLTFSQTFVTLHQKYFAQKLFQRIMHTITNIYIVGRNTLYCLHYLHIHSYSVYVHSRAGEGTIIICNFEFIQLFLLSEARRFTKQYHRAAEIYCESFPNKFCYILKS